MVQKDAGQFMVQNRVAVHRLMKPFHKAELNGTIPGEKNHLFDSAGLRMAFSPA